MKALARDSMGLGTAARERNIAGRVVLRVRGRSPSCAGRRRRHHRGRLASRCGSASRRGPVAAVLVIAPRRAVNPNEAGKNVVKNLQTGKPIWWHVKANTV